MLTLEGDASAGFRLQLSPPAVNSNSPRRQRLGDWATPTSYRRRLLFAGVCPAERGLMVSKGREKPLSLEQKQQVFAALVAARDNNMTPAQSRVTAAERFRLTEQQVWLIEQEGLEGGWSALG